MEPKKIDVRCPGCHGDQMHLFWQCHDVPVDVGRVLESPAEAKAVDRADIELCYCSRCKLIHNVAFDPSKVKFEPGYEVALHHSKVFHTFLENLANRLVAKYELRHKQILDIGCGDGFFLEKLCGLGPNYGVGVDPTVAVEGKRHAGEGNYELRRAFWSEEFSGLIGDFVVSQSVFEDIKEPLDFLQTLRRMLGERSIPLYFEVYNGFRPFLHRETWSIHFEACSYFSLGALQNLFQLAGFNILESGYCYQHDQYAYVEVTPGIRETDFELEIDAAIPSTVSRFASLHSEQVHFWSEQFKHWHRQSRNVVVWGSGAKSVNVLSMTSHSHAVRAVVDINPDRQGKYMPGSGHVIVSPESLLESRPDHVVLSNKIYRREVEQQLQEMGIVCELLVV